MSDTSGYSGKAIDQYLWPAAAISGKYRGENLCRREMKEVRKKGAVMQQAAWKWPEKPMAYQATKRQMAATRCVTYLGRKQLNGLAEGNEACLWEPGDHSRAAAKSKWPAALPPRRRAYRHHLPASKTAWKRKTSEELSNVPAGMTENSNLTQQPTWHHRGLKASK